MSEENVELLRQGVAAWNRRDLDGYLDLMEFHFRAAMIPPNACSGPVLTA